MRKPRRAIYDGHPPPWRALQSKRVAVLAAAALVAALSGLAGTGTSAAQTNSVTHSGTVKVADPQGAALADVEARDSLIFDQESLLNTYRCLFDVDVEVVPGGCAGGRPAGGPVEPGVFPGVPTAADVAARDSLIADQESLLNTYRCLFDVDVEVVPGGCATKRTAGAA